VRRESNRFDELSDGGPIERAMRSDEPNDAALERVLVIEDDADLREGLAAVLAPHYEVALAEDGARGLEVARRLLPALVISDLRMPVMSGIEVCRAIRAEQALADVPVIILTADRALPQKLEGFGVGADDYIQKPFNIDEFLARVRALLRSRALQRELAEGRIEAARLRTALEMAGALAHEINNPLSALSLECELLEKTLAGHPAAARLESIGRRLREIGEVVRRIQEIRQVKSVPYAGGETIVDLGARRERDPPRPPGRADAPPRRHDPLPGSSA
jgi:DNA-binding response OmpR family regulator